MGNVITVASVPANVRDWLTVSVLAAAMARTKASPPARVPELLAVSVLPSAIVSVALVVGIVSVILELLTALVPPSPTAATLSGITAAAVTTLAVKLICVNVRVVEPIVIAADPVSIQAVPACVVPASIGTMVP